MSLSRPAAGAPVGVLIVDDSAVARAVIARIVDASGRFAVAAAVGSVAAALAFLAHDHVGVILLDVAMPGGDGISALPDLLAASAGAHIVIVSSSAAEGAATTVRALALGAADAIVKPMAGGSSGRFGHGLIERLDRLCASPPPPPSIPARAGVVPSPSPSPVTGDGYAVVAIGASTGGIHALSGLLRELPAGVRMPILVTQHLPAPFIPYFAAQLALLARRPCDVAVDCLRIRPGRVIVAPGDAHMRLVALGGGGAAIRLSTTPAASGCLPSVDPMFASLADVFGARALAIVLSGMGRDGADGARAVHAAGGSVVVQDRPSSVVWGMPGAVAAQGIAAATLPPDAIGRLVATGLRA